MIQPHHEEAHENGARVADTFHSLDISPASSRIRTESSPKVSYFRSQEFGELVGCVVPLLIGVGLEYGAITPHQRPIPAQRLSSGDFAVNQVVNEQFLGETIPTVMLILLSGVAPITLTTFVAYFKGEMHEITCVFLLGWGLNLSITNSVKLYAGYLRPIFLDICEPNSSYQICTNSEEERGVRLSFPSGHASSSVCGLLLLSMFLERHFGVTKIRTWKVAPGYDNALNDAYIAHTGQPSMRRMMSIVCYAPMLLAFYIAASRVVDNKHFPADIIGGSLLGGSIAKLVFEIWFPTFPLANRLVEPIEPAPL